MKNIFQLLSVFVLFVSCSGDISIKLRHDEISLTQITDTCIKSQKNTIVYISDKSEEIFDSKVLKLLKNHFIFVPLQVERYNIINKIINSDQKRIFIVFNKGQISSIFKYSDNAEILLEKLENCNSIYSCENLSSLTEIEGDNITILDKINKNLDCELLSRTRDTSLINKYYNNLALSNDLFYSKYLIATKLKKNDTLTAKRMYNEIWNSLKDLERIIYPEELLEIRSYLKINHISNISKLEFKDKQVDLGNINRNTKKNCVFVFANKSDNPISIISISTSCSCASPAYPKYPVKSNQIDSIIITYHASSNIGGNNQYIFVKTSENATINLSILANII